MRHRSIYATSAFWIATLERAVKTAAQAIILVVVGSATVGGHDLVNILTVNGGEVAGYGLGGFVLSVLTSLVSGAVGNAGPSLATETVEPAPHALR